jgi:excisionase family DNA binding protein
MKNHVAMQPLGSQVRVAAERDLPLLLTVDETAQVLRTTRRAIYVMRSRGQLPGVTRIGRRVLVRSEDLLKWLDQKRTPSLDPAEANQRTRRRHSR